MIPQKKKKSKEVKLFKDNGEPIPFDARAPKSYHKLIPEKSKKKPK
jgi:hypothetical protein